MEDFNLDEITVYLFPRKIVLTILIDNYLHQIKQFKVSMIFLGACEHICAPVYGLVSVVHFRTTQTTD